MLKAPSGAFFITFFYKDKARKSIKMNIENIPFNITDWSQIEETMHAGETGYAIWKTLYFDRIRVRMVEYSADDIALAL